MTQKKFIPKSGGKANNPLLIITGVVGAIAGLLLFTKKGSGGEGILRAEGEPTIT